MQRNADFVPLDQITSKPAVVSCTAGFVGPIRYTFDRPANLTVASGSIDTSREYSCSAGLSGLDFTAKGEELAVTISSTK